MCNIAALDGTNQQHNVIDIYNVHLHQTTNFLNAPCNLHWQLAGWKTMIKNVSTEESQLSAF